MQVGFHAFCHQVLYSFKESVRLPLTAQLKVISAIVMASFSCLVVCYATS